MQHVIQAISLYDFNLIEHKSQNKQVNFIALLNSIAQLNKL